MRKERLPHSSNTFIELKSGSCKITAEKRNSVCRNRINSLRTEASKLAYSIYWAPILFRALYYVPVILFCAYNSPGSLLKVRNQRSKVWKFAPNHIAAYDVKLEIVSNTNRTLSWTVCALSHFSPVWLFVTPWTVAHQASLTIGFSRPEYWSGLPLPPPGIFPTQGSNLCLLHCRQILYHWATGAALLKLANP